MYEFTYYQARDVMSVEICTVRLDTSLKEIESIFEEHDFNGLPVVDGNGRLVGMVTKLDLLKAFDFSDKLKVPAYARIMNDSCERVMSRDVKAVRPETPLTRVLHDMIETRHKSFPVTLNDELQGIIAREDIIRALGLAAAGILPDRLKGADKPA